MKSKGKYNNENNLYENLTSKSEKVTCIKKKHKPRIIVSDHMGKYSASISNPSKMSNNPQERQEVEMLAKKFEMKYVSIINFTEVILSCGPFFFLVTGWEGL